MEKQVAVLCGNGRENTDQNQNQYGKISRIFIRTDAENKETKLADVYFTAPFKVMHPFDGENGWKEIMIMSVSAGIMAGDRQEYRMEIGSGSRVEITSQAYEKIHRMKEGFAERKTEITVEAGAALYYRPQPVIPFAGSDFRSRTCIHLQAQDSRLIMSDILCSGRAAMGEQFSYRYYSNLVEIYKGKENILSYRDNTKYIPGQKGTDMTGFGMYEGYGYLLNMIFCNVEINKEKQKMIQQCLGEAETEHITGGCTRTGDGNLVVRALGINAEKLKLLSDRIVKIGTDSINNLYLSK